MLMDHFILITVEGEDRKVREWVCPLCQVDKADAIDSGYAEYCREEMLGPSEPEPQDDPRPTPAMFKTSPAWDDVPF